MICKKCNSKINISLDKFSLIKGIAYFECSKCGNKENSDVSEKENTIEKIYWG